MTSLKKNSLGSQFISTEMFLDFINEKLPGRHILHWLVRLHLVYV